MVQKKLLLIFDENVQPHDYVKVTAKKQDGDLVEFDAMVRFDSIC